MWRSIILCGLLVFANRRDYHSTRYIIDHGGREANISRLWLVNHPRVTVGIDIAACAEAERERRAGKPYWYAVPVGLTVGHAIGYVANSATIRKHEGAAEKYDELLTLRKIAKTQSSIIKIQDHIIQIQKDTIKMLRHTPCDGKTQIASFQKGT